MDTSKEKFGIDHTRDDVFMATTEAQALIGEVMEEKGTEALVVINFAPDGSVDAIVSGLMPKEAKDALFERIAGVVIELDMHATSEIEQEIAAQGEADECRTIQIQSLSPNGKAED